MTLPIKAGSQVPPRRARPRWITPATPIVQLPIPASGAVGAVSVGAQAVGIAGTAPAPAVPAAVGGERPSYRYKLYDFVTGNLITDDLPHLHQSRWDDVGFQAGTTGRSAVGTFSIKLPPLLSDAYLKDKTTFDKVDYGQRLEAYVGNAQGGNPWVVGFIRSIKKSYSEFIISGDFYPIVLQLSRTGRSEAFSGTTDQLLTFGLKAYALTLGDDFSTGLGAWTNDGGWTQVTDPVTNQPALLSGPSGDGLLLSTFSASNAQYADLSVEGQFRMSVPGSGAAEASCVAAAADLNNLVLGQAYLRYVAPGSYVLDFYIYQKVAGLWAVKAQRQNAYPVPANSLPVNMELKGTQLSSSSYLWRILINGTDVGCFWNQTGLTVGSPTGKLGVRSISGQAYLAGAPFGFAAYSKQPLFQPGRISSGTQRVSQVFSDTPLMDAVISAATAEGAEFRFTYKPGVGNDTVDFGKTVGSDLSSVVRFDESNVTALSIEPNAEPFSTGVQSSAAPSSSSWGWLRGAIMSAVKKYGAILQPTSVPRISDVLAHRRFTQQLATLSSTPGQAKRVTVRRTPEVADQVRVMDWVELHLPKANFNHARVKVLGRVDDEQLATTEYLLDQLPRVTDRLPEMDRMKAAVEYLMSRASDFTATDPQNPGAVVRDPRTVLPVNPWRMRVYLNSAENFPASSDTLVNFDTITRDLSNGFSTGGHTFTAPVAGTWLVTATVGYNVPAVANANQLCQVYVYVNGSIAAKGPVSPFFQGSIGSSSPMSAIVADGLDLQAGDVVSIHLATGALGGTATAIATSTDSYWSMKLDAG